MRRTVHQKIRGMAQANTGQRAQTLIEFAFVLPIFLIMLVGIFEFGRALVEYNSLSNGAREGARAAIVPSKSVSDITAAARAATVSVGATPVVTITAYRNGSALGDPAARQSGDTVQVQVTHTFQPIFFAAHGYAQRGIGGLASIAMSGTAKMRVE
jgi:Flp pilus assembly protein TadG